MTDRKLSPTKYRFEKLLIALFFIFAGFNSLYAQDPSISISTTDTTICADLNTFYINFAQATNDSAVKWTTTGDGTFLPINDTTTYFPTTNDKSGGFVTLKFYAYPTFPSTHIDSSFLILRFTDPPIVDDIANQTACDSYTLPSITGTNLSGNQAYYTAPNGGGTQYLAGASITTSQTLYIYDSNTECSDQENFTITINNSPVVNDIADVIACDSYTLPVITGTNLSGNEAYYTSTGGAGTQYNAGQVMSSNTTLFIYDSNGSCFDQENFTITIVTSPNITNPGPQTACNSYTLPAITGTNLSGGQAYYSAPSAGGVKYLAGASISSSQTLYIYDSIGTCFDQENFAITIVTPPTVDDISNPTACNTYTLPTITGSNLSGGQAYYTATGAGGTKYLAGQIISSSMTLFIHDSIGSCHDEENFTITIVAAPNITNPGIQTSCNSYILPAIAGTNLSGGQAYYTAAFAGGTKYIAGASITSTQTLYIYDSIGTCFDQESFTITITNSPAVNDIANQSVCDSYTLPTITGTNLSGNQAFYTLSGGLGVKYVAGAAITSSTTLYIYDINGSCSDEQNFTITVTNSPTVNDISNPIVCDSYTLPAITGTNLSGNQAYYTASGGVGTKYIAGQTITTTQTLYIYDSNGSCSDEEQFTITINSTPIINNPGNQASCDSYTLPLITGTNLSGNQAYYTATAGGGAKYITGQAITSSTTLYIYDTNGSCSDQENFTITITVSPNITDIANPTVCDSYTLPTILGTNLSGNEAYYTTTGGGGTKYNAGESVSSSMLLYIYDTNGSCSDEENFTITIVASPAVNDIPNQSVCDSYTLPTITGSNLSGNEAYYTVTGGLGVKRNATDVITSTATLFIYDINGSCSDEESFTITVTNTPVVNDIVNPTACDSYTLPSITGTDLTGNQAYYTASGGAGTKYLPGAVLTSSINLYIFDSNGSCSSEEQFSITVNATPSINNPGNQAVCDSYTLPPITGTNLSGGQAYYTAPNGSGTVYNAGVTLTSTATLYIYDSNGSCSDQEQFSVNITNSPNITNPGNQISCNSYTLPSIAGTNLSGNQAYYTASAGAGVQYLAGQTISTSTFLYIYDANGSCSDEENFTVTILPPPVVNDPGDQIACGTYQLPVITGTNLSGNQAYYTATAGGGTRYDAGDFITASDIIFIYDNNGSCTSEESFNVTINPAPTISAGPNRSICGITTHTLSGSGTNIDAATISWTIIQGSGSLSATNISNPVYTPTAGDYLATVQLRISAEGTGACAGTTVTSDVFLTYSENVIISGPATATICQGQAFTTSPSTNTPSTYHWETNGNGTFDNDAILNTTYTPDSIDIVNGFVTLTVEATGAGTCSGNAFYDIVLEIKKFPLVNAGPAIVNICESDTYTTLDATAQYHSSAAWTVISGTGTISSPTSLTGAQYVPSAADIVDGYAILRLTVSNGDPCYTTRFDDIRIEFTNEPEITVGTIPTLCQGTPYTVTIADTAYSSSVAWTLVSGTGVLINATTINPTYTPSATDAVSGSIVLRLTASATSPCTASSTENITFPVTGIPTVDVGSDITVCSTTSSITLSPTVTNGISYLWTTSGSGTFSPSSTTLNPTYNPVAGDYAAGTIKLKLVVTGEALCSSTVSDSLNVIFTPAPTALVNATANVCEGIPYQISSAVATNYSNITWTHNGAGTLNNIHLEKPTYTQGTADIGNEVTFTMTVTGNGTCTPVVDQLVLTVLENPSINLNITETTVCGANYQISNVVASDYNTLTWTTSGNGSFDDANALNPRYTFGSTELASGTVSLTLTASANSPCATNAVESFIINIIDGPTANAGTDATICETENYITTTATAVDHASLEWSIVSGTGTFLSSVNNLSTTYQPSANDITIGSVVLRLTAFGNGSCPDDTDDITISIIKRPIVNAGANANACIGTAFNVGDASISNHNTYVWTSNGHGLLAGENTLTPSYTPDIDDININGGVVTLTLTASSNSPCSGDVEDTKILTIYNEPTAFAGNDAYVCAASDYLIQGATATYYSNLVWTSSSSGTLGFINNGTLTPTYHINSTDAANGSVDITLTAVPTAPCSTPATHTITLTVLAGPISDAGANTTICVDDVYTNADANPSGYTSLLWQTSGDGVFSSDTALHPTYIPGTADKINGVLTLTLHAYGAGNNGCNHDISEVTITINQLPTADAGTMTSICEGTNLIQGASVANQSNQYWTIFSGTGTLLNSNSLTPIYNTSPGDVAAGTVILQLVALPLSPCTDTAFSTLSLDVIEAPTAYAGADTTVCEQTPYHLWGATSNSLTNTIVWTSSGTGVFSDVNGVNPIYAPSSADVALGAVTLTLTASNGSCNDAIDVMTLTLASTIIDAGTDAISCVNTTYTANSAITGNYGTITWTENGNGSIIAGANSLTPVYQPDPLDAGTTVTMTMTVVKGTPCSGNVVDAFNLQIRPEPTATLGNDTTICENELLTIPGGHAIATNYTNIFWTTAGDGTFSSGGLTPTYYPGTNDLLVGFVELQIHVVNAPCLEATDEMIVTFSRLPVVNAGLDATVDVGASFNVTTATVSDASPILWTSSGASTVITGATTLTPTITPSTTDFANGSIQLTLTATPTGICTTPVSDYFILTVTDHPPVDFTWVASCEGTNTEFIVDPIVTDIPSIATYVWNFGDGNTFNSTVPGAIHNFPTSGTYTVTLTVTDTAGYTNIVSKPVIIHQIPVPNFDYDQPSCDGLLTQFTDYSEAPSGHIVEWAWDFDDGTDTTIYFGGNPNVTHLYTSPGTYAVTLNVKSSDSCVNAIILNVEVTAAPIASFRYSDACFGELTNLTDESTVVDGINIVAWDWEFGEPATGLNNRSTAQNPVHEFQTIGDHLVTLTVTNSKGCSNTVIDTVTISMLPTLDFDYAATCLNTPVQFTVDSVITAIATISNWLWDFGDGITATDQNPEHTYAASGNYTVSLTVLNLTGCSNTVSHTIEVYVAPIANFDFDAPTCSDHLVQFHNYSNTPVGTTIVEWKWYFGDGDSAIVVPQNNPDVTHLYDSAGIFTATLVITNSNGCESTISKNINILPSPLADFTFTEACLNELTQFTDASLANGGASVVSWTWNFGDPATTVNNTSGIQNPVHRFSAAGTFTVQLLIENSQGCTDTISHDVVVTPLPAVDFYIAQACLDTLVEFMVNTTVTTVSEIASYLWEFGDGQTSNVQNPVHMYDVDGNYAVTLTITDTAGCVNSVSHDLSLSALPQSLFGVSESQCKTDPIVFSNYSTSETGYITEWQWDFGDGNDTTITFPNNPNVSHVYSSEGTYTATLTVLNSNGCSNFSTQEITILPGPIANFDFESVCLDVSAKFTDLSQANGGGIITGWNWDFGDPTSGINNFSTLQNPSHLFKTVGDHDVLLTIYNEKGCMDTITKTINISMLPDIDFTTIGGTCLDGATQFLIDTILVDLSMIQSVLWNFGDGLSSNLRAPYHTYAVAGTYQITLTIIDLNGCTNTVTKEVNIDQLPDVKFDTDAPNCEGSETQFNDLSSTSNFIVKWHWEFGDGTDTIVNWPNNQNVTHIYPSSGSYQAKLTITTSDSCINTAEKIITIIPAPVANFAATTACINHPAEFTDLSQENNAGVIVDWLWDFGDPTSGINNNSSRQNPVHEYAVSGTYLVSLTITNAEGCQSTYSDSLAITLPPALDPFTFNDVICVNTAAEFFMSNNVNLADVQTILWDFGDPTSSDNISSEQNPTHIYQTAGEYIVTLTLDNDNCGGSISDTIIVNSRPQAGFEFTNACIGSPTVFTDLSLYSDSPIEKWKWDFGILNLLSDTSSIQNPVYTYRALGQHYVSLEVTNAVGCSDKLDSVFIEIFPTPTAKFSFIESDQGTLSFTNESVDADTYEWSFGDGWISNETDPIHVYDSANSMISSTYENLELMLISLNNVGCADTATKFYDLYFKGLYIPTAFSPNNPSESVRYFKPMGVNLETFKIEVYSTWNQLLWESSALDENGSPTESWDGTFNGSALPSGVYIWKASGVFKDGTLWKGNLIGTDKTGYGATSGTLLLIR